MALASSRLVAFLATFFAPLTLFALTGCQGDDDGATATATLGESTSPTSSSGPGAPTTDATGDTSTSTSTGVATTSDATTGSATTGSASATTDDDTTGDDTGPLCEPGAGDCVCDEGECVDGYVCASDLCVAAPLLCPGDLEPDNSEETARDVGSITDNDSDAFPVSGVLSGASDVDWYTYHGKDTFGYIAQPTLSMVQGAQRLCQFLVCDEGGAALTEVSCPDGTKFAISPQLRPGCCGEAAFGIKDFNCKGQDESVRVWVRVDKPVADACSPYGFTINF